MSIADRGASLWKLEDLCQQNAHILATIDAWDNGKPYQQALDEDLSETVSVFRYYAGWTHKVHGQTIETSPLKLAYTKHGPLGKPENTSDPLNDSPDLGVCGQIMPWNFPVMVHSITSTA